MSCPGRGSSANRILVVNDKAPIRRLLRASLGTQGFEVIEVANRAEAHERLGEILPDLIILDLGLPDVPGRELLRQWRGKDIDSRRDPPRPHRRGSHHRGAGARR